MFYKGLYTQIYVHLYIKKCHDNIKSFRIDDTDISCEDNVSLLGVKETGLQRLSLN